jgi:DNA-binding CsgD family transcriptional regulator
LVEGDSYKLIAGHYEISIGTVQKHIVHIYQKLQVNSKGEAITKALRDKLVSFSGLI